MDLLIIIIKATIITKFIIIIIKVIINIDIELIIEVLNKLDPRLLVVLMVQILLNFITSLKFIEPFYFINPKII